MGVVVLYFTSPANDIPGLMDYVGAVVKSAASLSELMVQRWKFSERRVQRVNRNLRVMKIAVRFMAMMLVR